MMYLLHIEDDSLKVGDSSAANEAVIDVDYDALEASV